LYTKDHFTSNWTSRVSGGKRHDLVVGILGVLPGQKGQPCDRVLVDPDQPGGLADAAPLGQVLQDRQDLVVGELGIEERRPLELGEAGLAGAAIEQAVAGLAEVVDDKDVVPAPSAVGVAVGVLAAEAGDVVHGRGASWADPCRRVRSWTSSLLIGRIPFNADRTPPALRGSWPRSDSIMSASSLDRR
jgi:hypothetical protein